MKRQALWSDLIHNCNIDFLKKRSFESKITYVTVFIDLISVIQIDNTKRNTKTIRKYKCVKMSLIHILSLETS
jgi:hypothetical protein